GQAPRSGGYSGPRRDEGQGQGRPIREGYSPFRSDRGHSDQGDSNRRRDPSADRDPRARRPDYESRPPRGTDAPPRSEERPRAPDRSGRDERAGSYSGPDRQRGDDRPAARDHRERPEPRPEPRPESRPESRSVTPPRAPAQDRVTGATRTRGATFRSRPSGRPNFQIRPRAKGENKE
ncbi:MAG: hypothetical protein WCJ55_17295, partial [Chloroflexales bacterium]